MRLAVRFFEELPNHILTSCEEDRVEREMSVFLALFSFYAHLMMLFATQRLTVVQLDYLQKHITAVACEGVINYCYAGCTEEAQQNLANALTKNLSEGITGYVHAIGGTRGASKEELATKLPDQLSRAGSEVAKACGRPSDADAIEVIKEHLFINYMVIVEAVKVDETKSGKDRTVPLNDVARRTLLELRNQSDGSPEVFVYSKTGKSASRHQDRLRQGAD